MDTNVVNVDDYAGLRRAIRDFVRGGVEHGVIRVQQYTGTLEDDLAAAAYSVAREDQQALTWVDYMTQSVRSLSPTMKFTWTLPSARHRRRWPHIPYVSGRARTSNGGSMRRWTATIPC